MKQNIVISVRVIYSGGFYRRWLKIRDGEGNFADLIINSVVKGCLTSF